MQRIPRYAYTHNLSIIYRAHSRRQDRVRKDWESERESEKKRKSICPRSGYPINNHQQHIPFTVCRAFTPFCFSRSFISLSVCICFINSLYYSFFFALESNMVGCQEPSIWILFSFAFFLPGCVSATPFLRSARNACCWCNPLHIDNCRPRVVVVVSYWQAYSRG